MSEVEPEWAKTKDEVWQWKYVDQFAQTATSVLPSSSFLRLPWVRRCISVSCLCLLSLSSSLDLFLSSEDPNHRKLSRTRIQMDPPPKPEWSISSNNTITCTNNNLTPSEDRAHYQNHFGVALRSYWSRTTLRRERPTLRFPWSGERRRECKRCKASARAQAVQSERESASGAKQTRSREQ